MISPTIPWHVITGFFVVLGILVLIIFYLISVLNDTRNKHDDRTVKVIENHVKYTIVLDKVLLNLTTVKDELKDELRETRRHLMDAIREYSKRG